MVALIVGNSDGIGLALTRHLLERGGVSIVGVSRSESPLEHPDYRHVVLDVTDRSYLDQLASALGDGEAPALVVYCAGVGELLDLDNLQQQRKAIEVSLNGLVATVEVVLPAMLRAGDGHIIALSSLADAAHSPDAPGYAAAKAGASRYLESLALAVADRGVALTNVRFGFVDTKMAKGNVRPMMMSVERAVERIVKAIDRRRPPKRVTAPLPMALLVSAMGCLMWLRLLIP